jgi:putative membrane-bound dehydrogenase-like protein
MVTNLIGKMALTLWMMAGMVVPLLGQGYPADEAADHMTVPEGFEVRLFAAEPDIRQPVAMEFDDRGRMWIIQYLQYPNPAGLQRVQVDRYSRTQYDRMPDPPPHGTPGADRITICEDTDGDGRADTFKDFIAGLNLASGIAFGHDGVFVLQAPYLLFYPDRNRDDVPDTDPQVLLKGFGMNDAHSVANSLIFGPDGWLYGNQGSTVTANVRGHVFQQGVWRYHPVTKAFELFYEGGGNMWGLDFDSRGNLFSSTNYGPYLMVHGVQGGYYWKKFDKHGELHNPYTFGYFDHVAHHNAEGGHVTVGGLVYQGDGLPESFRGQYIAANLLTHNVYWHDIKALGSTFTTHHAGELLDSNDTWFAPSDFNMGPDGSLFVADWHDERTAHPDPDAEWDRRNGRIYQIRWKSSPSPKLKDLSRLSSDQLVDQLGHRSNYFARKARILLTARRDVATHPRLRGQVFDSDNDRLALESLWTLYASGGFDDTLAKTLLKHRSADVRRWTVRYLGDAKAVSPEVARLLVDLAGTEPDVVVRSQLASTAKRLSPKIGLAIARTLVLRDEDNKDTHLPLLLWWAVEHFAMADMDLVLSSLTSREAWASAMVRDEILSRLMRCYAAQESPEAFGACARLLSSAPNAEEQGRMIAALDQGLQGIRQGVPAELTAALERLWRDETQDPVLIRAAARLGHRRAKERAMALAIDSGVKESTRLAMLGFVAQVHGASCVDLLLPLVGGSDSEALRAAVIRALQRFTDDRIVQNVLFHYPKMSASLRKDARDLLFGRKTSALAFLKDVDGGNIDPAEVTPAELGRLHLLEDDEIEAAMRAHWGAYRAATPEEKLAEVRRLNNDVRFAKGDPGNGRLLYEQTCAKCHRMFGLGAEIGPDLTQSNRKDTQFMLVSLVDPSVQIRKEYLSYIVETKDGRVFTGIVLEKTPTHMTLINADAEKVKIATPDVADVRESQVSLMPEELFKPLKPSELRDLFAFLQMDDPGPHDKTPPAKASVQENNSKKANTESQGKGTPTGTTFDLDRARL